MKEEILFELAKQAGFTVSRGEIFSPYHEEYGIEELLENFAKIILNQVAVIIEKNEIEMYMDSNMAYIPHVISDIYEEFWFE